MAQTIDPTTMSLQGQKYPDSSQQEVEKHLQRLDSGVRITEAKDDAAGLAVTERMNSVLRGMNLGIRNANDGISMTQLAESGLDQVGEKLQRMRELAVQSSHGTDTWADRKNLNAEYSQLNSEISRITSTIEFNSRDALASVGGSTSFQVGSGSESENAIAAHSAAVVSLSGNISTGDESLASIIEIDSVIDFISDLRDDLSAMRSLFESTIEKLLPGAENQSAEPGWIADEDMALETANETRSQMMRQAGNAVSVQANASAQGVMQLLA